MQEVRHDQDTSLSLFGSRHTASIYYTIRPFLVMQQAGPDAAAWRIHILLAESKVGSVSLFRIVLCLWFSLKPYLCFSSPPCFPICSVYPFCHPICRVTLRFLAITTCLPWFCPEAESFPLALLVSRKQIPSPVSLSISLNNMRVPSIALNLSHFLWAHSSVLSFL